MWIFWIIVIVIAIYWFFLRNRYNYGTSDVLKQNKAGDLQKEIISVDTSNRRLGCREIGIGYQQTEDGGFVIGPELPFPMTLYGLDLVDTVKLVNAFEQGEDYEISEWFSHLVAQKNIQCKELNDWINLTKPIIRDTVKRRVLASTEWSHASNLDKKDLLIEIQESAIAELDMRPSSIDAAKTLLLAEPLDLTIDDALLDRFKDNPQTYRTLLNAISVGTKVQIASAGSYLRKTFDELYEKGFMLRGREIAIEDILESMLMKQMQEIAGTDAPKKFTRKAHAIDFLKGLPDIRQRLEKVISFRELFQIKPIDGINLDELAKTYEYSNQVGRVVLETLRTSVDSRHQRGSRMDEDADGWELFAENCCPSCNAQHGKTWKRFPQKLPPFHIGCGARIHLQYK